MIQSTKLRARVRAFVIEAYFPHICYVRVFDRRYHDLSSVVRLMYREQSRLQQFRVVAA